jgi:histidine triad (HIT) family protein
MAEDCLFCKIAAKQIPAKFVREGERVVAFEDLNPVAPHHVLVIPREHLASTLSIGPAQRAIAGELIEVAADIARERGFADAGYRLVFNTNRDAGMTVHHIHLHLLGGRRFGWPPG